MSARDPAPLPASAGDAGEAPASEAPLPVDRPADGAGRVALPVVAPSGRGPRTQSCPPRLPGVEAHCWKFVNPDPGAAWDFYVLATLQAAGDAMLVTQTVALEDGGRLHVVRSHEYRETVENHWVKELVRSHSGFGPVRISRLKVREVYHGFIRSFFRTRTRVSRYDPRNRLVSTRVVAGYPFPPLAGASTHAGPAASRAARGADPLLHLDRVVDRPRAAIRFPRYRRLPDGDLLVSGGEPVDPGHGRGAPAWSVGAFPDAGRPPGVYVELANQEGSPPLLATVFWEVDESRVPRLVGGTWCTGYSYEALHTHVFVEKKSSWSGQEIQITRVRDELRLDGTTCRDF